MKCTELPCFFDPGEAVVLFMCSGNVFSSPFVSVDLCRRGEAQHRSKRHHERHGRKGFCRGVLCSLEGRSQGWPLQINRIENRISAKQGNCCRRAHLSHTRTHKRTQTFTHTNTHTHTHTHSPPTTHIHTHTHPHAQSHTHTHTHTHTHFKYNFGPVMVDAETCMKNLKSYCGEAMKLLP
jgi:hypothetical protein